MTPQFHPGQFPIGSLASRAAARSLMEERRAESKLVDTVLWVKTPAEPEFSEWVWEAPGAYTRRSSIPEGMTFDEALTIAGLPPVQTKGDYLRISIPDSIRTVPSNSDVQPEW